MPQFLGEGPKWSLAKAASVTTLASVHRTCTSFRGAFTEDKRTADHACLPVIKDISGRGEAKSGTSEIMKRDSPDTTGGIPGGKTYTIGTDESDVNVGPGC